MSFEQHTVLNDAIASHAELESLVERVIESALTRIENHKPYVNSQECAHLIGVTPEHLCAMRSRGEGPPWSGAGKWTRYQRSAVLTWLANLPREKNSSPSEKEVLCKTPAERKVLADLASTLEASP